VGRVRGHLLRGDRLDRRGQEPLIVRDEPVFRRRRRVAAALFLTIVALGVVALALASGGEDSPAPTPQATLPPVCTGEPRAALGARIVVRMEGKATPGLLRAGRDGEIGGVILFPPEGADPAALAREVTRLQEAAAEAGNGPLVVAVDQEGGEVKRLPGLPPDVAPADLAGDPAGAEAEGVATGEALAGIGVNVDLAPVLDVPQQGSFLGTRTFGSTPEEVAAAGVAFADGLRAHGVAATAKHFPGLGRSAANTDEAESEVAASAGEIDADLVPFEAAIADGIELVMLSSAVYPELDPKLPAFASPAIAEDLLRSDLGFEGVTVSDDLGAGAVTARYDAAAAALAAARGGTDLLLFALTPDPGVLDSLVAAAKRGGLEQGALEASCARVLALRGTLGE
jgi:beta-N-acetylhexosaminidase